MNSPNFAVILDRPELGELKISRFWESGDYSCYKLEEPHGDKIVEMWYPGKKLELIYKEPVKEHKVNA